MQILMSIVVKMYKSHVIYTTSEQSWHLYLCIKLLFSINSSTAFWQCKFGPLYDSCLNDRYSNSINFVILVTEANNFKKV